MPDSTAASTEHMWAFAIVWTSLFLLAYFTPTIIGKIRGHHNLLGIAMLNLFAGWTVVGWIIAIIWAVTRPATPQPQVSVFTGQQSPEASAACLKCGFLVRSGMDFCPKCGGQIATPGAR